MGQWTVTIHGHGGHDNNSPNDIEALLAKFLADLRAAGQDIEVATSLTIGTRREVSASGPTDPGTGGGPQPQDPPKTEPPVVPHKPKAGLFLPDFYYGGVPPLSDLTKDPYKYPAGAVVVRSTQDRGGVRWGVIDPSGSNAIPEGYALYGKAGE